ncbi:MAG TPA: GMC oxidoreductase [Solirubrobacteraceae bacterium]|nr:GMC oxidoreductase [Solirubrobacteraceae bacterium]
MIRPGTDVADGAALEADVVVVGSGPMGTVVALELSEQGHRVLLVESGGPKFERAAQDLARHAGNDPWHVPADLAVRRQIGGTSVTWGGRCVPFDPVDFEPRPAVPEALWPVRYEEMARHLGRACDWSRCGKPAFSALELPELAGRSMIPGFRDGDVLTTSLERWSLPTRFGHVYRRQLERSRRVDLITGLTCTHIACDPASGVVDHLVLRSLAGPAATARGRFYVLATGGLEATRLLMASNDVHADGIGNGSGHLGRWYMAHVEARVANVHLTTPPESTIHDHELDADGVYVRRRFTFSPDLQRRKGLPNAAVWFVNPDMGDPAHGSGILSGVYLTLVSPVGRFMLAEAIRQARTKTSGPVRRRDHVRNIVRDLGPAARFALDFSYRRFLKPGRKAPGFFVRSAANIYPLDYHGEHRPNPDSRVVLTPERDALGVPRIRTELRFSDEDVASVEEAMRELDRALRDAGVGHLEFLFDDIPAGVRECLLESSGFHQTGTTRMAASAADGVVDANLAVFGTENLFVASTSTFPTSSQANPTLTGIAFAVRLAGHLDERLRLTAEAAALRGLQGAARA